MSKAEQDAEAREAVARGLQGAGYRGGVVIAKLVWEHGLEQRAAEALVARLYGWRETYPARVKRIRLTVAAAGILFGVVLAAGLAFVYGVDSSWASATQRVGRSEELAPSDS